MRSTLLLTLALLCAATVSAQRQKETKVYSEYFTSYDLDSIPPSVTVNWKGAPSSVMSKSPRGIEHLGRFTGGEEVRLTLTGLPEHRSVKLSIGFHVIGSWDGEHDDDRFTILVDGKRQFSETFSNTIYKQSFPALTRNRKYPARTGARNSNMLGYRFVEKGVYDGPMDASYIEELEVTHSGDHLEVVLTADLMDVRKGIDNESWGIEHITVHVLGEAPSQDMWPTAKQAEPERIWDHAEIVDFEGKDERVVAGFTQHDDLPGIVPGSPWEKDYHAIVLHTKCMSCGAFCMMYTIRIYHDTWINVWSNREPYGQPSWSTSITPVDMDSIKRCVINCLDVPDMASEYEAEDIFENPDQPHCKFPFRAYGRDHEVHIYGGEPPQITETLDVVMRILKRHGWEPTPFVGEYGARYSCAQ